MFDTFVDIQTPIPKLAEPWWTDALVGAEGVDALELAVVLAGRALVLVLAALAIYKVVIKLNCLHCQNIGFRICLQKDSWIVTI